MSLARYSNGIQTFANICTPCENPFMYKFAPMVYDGNVQVYRATWRDSIPTRYGKRPYVHSLNFIQKKGSRQIGLFRYQTARNLITQGEPGYAYVSLFKRRRTRARLGVFGGMMLGFGGTALLSSNSVQSDLQYVAGGLCFAAGLTVIIWGAIAAGTNREYTLQKAIAVQNGLDD